MSQCEWILYESGHKFFMKASQILYKESVTLHKESVFFKKFKKDTTYIEW